MAADAPILCHRTDGIARVVLNRAAARNALNLPMCLALRETFEALEGEADIHAILIEADGPVFCAGADLKERDGKDEAWVRHRRQASFAAYEAIERCSRPVVAVTQGPVVGSGGEIAMACDFIIASDRTTFRFPEPQWGTVGATQRLQRVVGKRRAKELLFTGRLLSAADAFGYGLVARIVPHDDLEEAARATAAAIAAAPPMAMMLTKRAVDLGEETHLVAGIGIERMAIDQCLMGAEWREGLARFAERRDAASVEAGE